MEDMKKELADLADGIKASTATLKTAVEAQQKELSETKQVSADTAKKVADATKAHDELVKQMSELQGTLVKRMDEIEAQAKRFSGGQPDADEFKSAGQLFVESEARKSILNKGGDDIVRRNSDPVSFKRLVPTREELQKATVMLSNMPDRFVQPTRIGPMMGPMRRLRIRDLIPVRPTTVPNIEYLQEVGFFAEADAVSVSGIVRSGSVATATFAAPHGLYAGQRVKIIGAAQAEYNGAKTITAVPSSTTIKFAVDSGAVTPATGTITAIDLTPHAGAAGMVAEGGTKPEAALEFELKSATTKTIAHWIPITRQAVADAPQLRSYIDDRLLYGLAYKEERQLLYGDGTGQNLEGLLANANRQRYNWSDGPLTTDTKIDAVRRALTRVALAEYEPTGAIIHPLDWEDIQLLKGDDGHYLFFPADSAGLGLGESAFFRIPVVVTPAIQQGHALVGAFAMAATIWDREQAEIRVTDSHADYFIKNQLAILAEERVGLATYRPEAFVDVTFDSAPA